LWRTAIQKVSLIVVPVAMFFIVSAEEFVQLAFTGDYIRAVSIFRIYSLITMARVASFGAVIVAAGQPKLVFRAAIVTLLSNLLLSIPALYWFGFDGPALGTAAAFIPMAAIYCYYIGRSLGVPMSRTFPVVDWLKVVAVATLAASPAIALKTTVVLHPFIALFVYALTLLILYIFLARVTNLMKAEDLDFAVRWVQLDFFRRRSRPSSTESK
ncbi:MAG: polysaccharide biosynthesis C-terminal domain-containing protein, partial [Myxococcota bacterium]